MYCTSLIGQVREQRNYLRWYCRISCTSLCISRINFNSILTIITFVLDKPSKPGTPEVKDSDKDFIEIEWDPPRKDGGAPITGYNVERKDPRTGRWNKVNRDPVTVSPDFYIIQTIQSHQPVVFFSYQQHMEFICVSLQTPRFRDEKVQPGKEYEYRVAAVNEGGESEPSDASSPIKAKPLKRRFTFIFA